MLAFTNRRALRSSLIIGGFLVVWSVCQGAKTPAGAQENTHRVEVGETLHAIARQYGTSVEALMAANGIDDPRQLGAGQRLVLPSFDDGPSAAGHGAGWQHWHESPPARSRRSEPPLLRPDFGRILPPRSAPPSAGEMEALKALGARMVEPPGSGARFDSEVPAGYTFLGQFIDHDITLAVGGELNGDDTPKPLRNLRTAALDLDSVYGAGPALSPHLYDLPYLRAGHVIYRDHHAIRHALPRLEVGEVALIADIRNDENFIIAQLHAAFIAFHNRMVDLLIAHRPGDPRAARRLTQRQKRDIFEEARKHVIHYYHRLILEDYLPRLIGVARTETIFREGRRLYFPDGFDDRNAVPFMPISFAAAAFRYGHSQVRESYVIRDGREIDLGSDLVRRGMRTRAKDLLVDWRFFFDISNEPPRGFNFARLIDPLVVRPLHRLPEFATARDHRLASLPVRNLLRNAQFHLPSGQRAAALVLAKRYWGHEPHILPPGSDRFLQATLGDASTPLWYYILQEAALLGHATGFGYAHHLRLSHHSGQRGLQPAAHGHRRATYGHTLGPLGGVIVGEVLIGLLDHYRETTGDGLAFRPIIKAHPRPRRGHLTLSPVVSFEGGPAQRFLMRDFLIAAGVAGPIRF